MTNKNEISLPAEVSVSFLTHSEAWAFCRAIQNAKQNEQAGYPSLDGKNTVRVLAPTAATVALSVGAR